MYLKFCELKDYLLVVGVVFHIEYKKGNQRALTNP